MVSVPDSDNCNIVVMLNEVKAKRLGALQAHGSYIRNRATNDTLEVSEKSYAVEYSRIIKKMVAKRMVVCGPSTSSNPSSDTVTPHEDIQSEARITSLPVV